jgi:hypothetical protein
MLPGVYYNLQSEMRSLSFQTNTGQSVNPSFELDVTDSTSGLTSKDATTSVLVEVVSVIPGPLGTTGDFNNDGHTDITLQNDNGTVVIWEMNGTNFIGGGAVANPGSSWGVFDDRMKFIYSNAANETLAATAAPDEFVLTNPSAGTHTVAGFNLGQDVVELSKARFPSFADVQAATSSITGGSMINLGGDSSLLLPGINSASLHANNFVLA